MKRLWAPWRLEYVLSPKEDECIFCCKPKESNDKDRKNLILYRGEHNFIILNLYPYNNGHLMIVPYKHTDVLTTLAPEEMGEMGILTQKSIAVLEKLFTPQGFNVGINIGTAAGAGIKEHVHMHVVPRWEGDTNFMAAIGDTRVMVQHINETYDSLVEGFKKL
ncbi:MAG: HIT domain-containing protein [Nitrospinota bacterium]